MDVVNSLLVLRFCSFIKLHIPTYFSSAVKINLQMLKQLHWLVMSKLGMQGCPLLLVRDAGLRSSHELAGSRVPTAVDRPIVFYVLRVHKRSTHSDM